ncbi:MAG: cobyrinic acid a,c-diamide synthase [Bacilli bacterium]|nr:cobyrinic acid a,c-diamide synthase [Bacilli bacterium]
MFDQAQGLRSMVGSSQGNERLTRVIAISSGKGGVGKSNFTLNFALGLSAAGKRVVIIDADVGFANIDVLMGVTAKYSLQDLMLRKAVIWEILQKGPGDLQFIAGGSGLADLLTLSQEDLNYLMQQLGQLHGYADYVLIDTGAGLNAQTLRLILSADELFVVSTPEPTSITDAYALIKLVALRGLGNRVKLVVNRSSSNLEGQETAEKLRLVASRFLQLDLPVLGYMPDDLHVSKAVKSQQPFYLLYPESDASRSINRMVQHLLHSQEVPSQQEFGMKSFLNRMMALFK